MSQAAQDALLNIERNDSCHERDYFVMQMSRKDYVMRASEMLRKMSWNTGKLLKVDYEWLENDIIKER